MILFGAFAAYGFVLIGEACAATRQPSYVGAWSKTLGPRSSFLPAIASLLLCSTAGIACASVLADTGVELLAAGLALQIESVDRNAVLSALAITTLTPLCLLPSLAPLGTASYFGVAGVGVTAACMLVRLADGTYGGAGLLPSADEAAAVVDAAGVLMSAAQWAPPPDALATATDAVVAATPLADPAEVAFTELARDGVLGPLPPIMPVSTLPSAGALGFFISLMSNAYLAHYNAPGVLTALQTDGVTATALSAAPIEIQTSERMYLDSALAEAEEEADGDTWQAALGMRLKRAAEISDEFAEYASKLGEGTFILTLLNTMPMFDFSIPPHPAGSRSLWMPPQTPATAAPSSSRARRPPRSSPPLARAIATAERATAAAAAAAAAATAEAAMRGAAAAFAAAGGAKSISSPVPVDVPSAAFSASSSDALAPFRRVALTAFGISSLLFIVIGCAGYATFGQASLPLILSNYDPADPLAAVARVGVAAAVLCEFPLLERPFRETVIEVLRLDAKVAKQPLVAIASVAFLCGIAATNVQLDTISALGGATGGALLIYIAPALMTMQLRMPDVLGEQGDAATGSAQQSEALRPRSKRAPPLSHSELLALSTLVVVGVVCGAIGTIESLH